MLLVPAVVVMGLRASLALAMWIRSPQEFGPLGAVGLAAPAVTVGTRVSRTAGA
ncbi:hypothetical protein [Streptomyces cupreus]|uniref:Uncharacterized protein n=1 Tax=Streptomyces cupreus TaxID=2759956 RepID=A0A7X1MDU9_9ACTN|nr:hypothetical protein [Streptomyces cupreus]MBC2905095.1 hypothetical protein [Streptomyces cupreus]